MNVTVNYLHPGCINSNFAKGEIPLLANKFVNGRFLKIILTMCCNLYNWETFNRERIAIGLFQKFQRSLPYWDCNPSMNDLSS